MLIDKDPRGAFGLPALPMRLALKIAFRVSKAYQQQDKERFLLPGFSSRLASPKAWVNRCLLVGWDLKGPRRTQFKGPYLLQDSKRNHPTQNHRDCECSENGAKVPTPYSPSCSLSSGSAGWCTRVEVTCPGLLCPAGLMLNVNILEMIFAFGLEANLPNCNDKTLYADGSLFSKTRFAFNECLTWHLVVVSIWWLGARKMELLKPLNKWLFNFLLIKFLGQRTELKSTGNTSIQESFQAHANINKWGAHLESAL